ncbi:uncharacterized protein LOC125042018 [Penaeus chinensis]|uniref:uncharacterized protein LOC125042018 n=1 Tax=Penaeus chinensis TaxID=139456 RepID=UPI001FB77A4B|nr:uncharacterized protein LOC125042018 [Penaeus chinensis]
MRKPSSGATILCGTPWEMLEATSACDVDRLTGDRDLRRPPEYTELQAPLTEHRPKYFEQLYQVDPPAISLDASGVAGLACCPGVLLVVRIPGKILAQMSLRRIQDQLLRYQRLKQSGFTPAKSTIDHIMVLKIIMECSREFASELLADYINLKKAFDSVHRISLRDILRELQ